MTTPTDVSPPADDPEVATEQTKTTRPRSSRLNQALAWVGIVAGGLFIVAGIFFSGFFLSWWSLGGQSDEHMGPGMMACCSHMKPGEQMKPGEMMPGMTMTPGGMMGPSSQSPTTAPPSTPRP